MRKSGRYYFCSTKNEFSYIKFVTNSTPNRTMDSLLTIPLECINTNEYNQISKTVDETDTLGLLYLDQDTETLSKPKSIIFNKLTGKIVVMNFPETEKITNRDELLPVNFESKLLNVFDSHEGTILWVYNVDGRWNVSTTRKICAHQSKWSDDKHFGTQFEIAMRRFFKQGDDICFDDLLSPLNKNMSYSFMQLSYGKNIQLEINNKEFPRFLFLGVQDMQKNTFTFSDHDNIYGFPIPKKHSFKTQQEVFDYVKGCDLTKIQGVIIFDGFKNWKVVHEHVLYVHEVRGNTPCILMAYLSIRRDVEKKKIFVKYFSGHINTSAVERDIFSLCLFIFKSYKQRYIYKNYISVPKPEFLIMNQIYSEYLDGLSKGSKLYITLDYVKSVVDQQPSHILKGILTRSRD
jgi:hypothetical protein